MSTEQKAYDLGRFQRIVGVEGPRVTGKFATLATKDGGDVTVKPMDVTVYDESRSFGVIFGGDDFTAWVTPEGIVRVPEHMISERRRYDFEDVREEFTEAIRLVADAALFEWRAP